MARTERIPMYCICALAQARTWIGHRISLHPKLGYGEALYMTGNGWTRLMKVFAAAAIALFFVAPSPAAAGVLICDAGLAAAGVDCTPPEVVLCYAMSSGTLSKLVDDVAEQFGYPTIPCTSADVTAGRCSGGQLGAAVTTPETKQAFAGRMIGVLLAARIYNRDKRIAADAAAAAVTPPAGIE